MEPIKSIERYSIEQYRLDFAEFSKTVVSLVEAARKVGLGISEVESFIGTVWDGMDRLEVQ